MIDVWLVLYSYKNLNKKWKVNEKRTDNHLVWRKAKYSTDEKRHQATCTKYMFKGIYGWMLACSYKHM